MVLKDWDLIVDNLDLVELEVVLLFFLMVLDLVVLMSEDILSLILILKIKLLEEFNEPINKGQINW